METLSEKDDKYVKGWSWGAFFGSWIFLFVNKQRKLGWKILALFLFMQLFSYVPVFAAQANGFGKTLGLIYFGIGIWLGIRGREIVWKSGVYPSVEEFRKKQSLVTKLTVIFIILNIAMSVYFFVSTFGKYISHPEILDQQIMEQALVKAKSSDSNINDSEFGQGYQKGITDGKADISKSFTADQTNSYQQGYNYGYVVGCMGVHNDQILCVKKMVGGQ